MKVLITGVTGLVGRALISKFFVMLDLEKTFNFRKVRLESIFGRRIDGSG
jgi:hypothetical protein